ncbi:preprotein translocase subunit SecG [Engelhardtia mirabilis]|uniref:Protein-export membrane protein SecG n=1 Tax=Engelhardtia mirabilis TaxID=2528011 RepID=A0A518BRV3_9BACT|nr:preprotein translocase subunit SecG [Planctomycetes bacterium Pla133]QDV04024.1 preprotein translocase subunit SecG [Planctomycetes bacterium Pla86]
MVLLLNLVFVFACLLLIAVVLVQEGKGGGLGNAFGGAGQQTFGVGTSGITKFTAVVCAAMLALAIAIHKTDTRQSDSIVGEGDIAPTIQAPLGGQGGGAPTGGTGQGG